ncbi:MAG TPA: hypothetical protein VMU84_00095 [Thermoanaerobaculia bacterium]|nr:hypothetical protein [Thermoanaerobaculia bacterium]
MTLCTSCGRMMCTEHLSPTSGFTQCLECANQNATHDENATDYDNDWSYRYRHSYYAHSGYVPISSNYYDDDVRSFDQSVGDTVADDDEAGDPSFGDS